MPLDELVQMMRASFVSPAFAHPFAGGPARAAAAVDLGTEIVDDDFGALPRELQRVAPADPAAGARHDDDPSLADATHRGSTGQRPVPFTTTNLGGGPGGWPAWEGGRWGRGPGGRDP